MKRLTDHQKRTALKWAAILAWGSSCALLHLSLEFEQAFALRGFLMFSLAIAATATAAAVVTSFLVPLERVYDAAYKAGADQPLRLVNGQPERPVSILPIRPVSRLSRSDN